MKIKRFVAPDMKQAIREVREELGPDAVILSNTRVRGGTEIVAAVDYDESLWAGGGDAPRRDPREREQALEDLRHSRDIPQRPAPAPPRESVWSQEPTLVEMHNELRSLRGLLHNQLSGLAWGEEARRRPLHARLIQRLVALGLHPALARRLADQVPAGQDFDHCWRQALGLLARSLSVTGDDIIERGGVVALVGPSGVGKTTTVAKLAARYSLRHGLGRVALVTTDNYRVGAHEQLRTFARILGVPMRAAGDAEELRATLDGLHDKPLVLIDTAGMSQRDMRLNEQLAVLQASSARMRTYAVLSATTQRAALDETVRAFKRIPLAGCVLTKLDETSSLGGALSIALQHALPVAYVGDGQRVPEDLHPARPHQLVSRSVALMQQRAARQPQDEAVTIAMGGIVANAHA